MSRTNPSTTLKSDAINGSARPVPAHHALVETQHAPITICHPVWRLGRGGLERQLVQIVNHLPGDRFRHVVVIYGCDPSSEPLASEIREQVAIVREPLAPDNRNCSRRLAAIMTEHAANVVHVRGLSLLLDAVMAADCCGDVKLACSFHGFQSADDEFTGVRRKIMREAILRCQDRWAVSPTAARTIESRLNLPAGAFGHTNNGVDADRFAPPSTDQQKKALRQQLNLPSDATIVLCLGNMKPIKGQSVLLEALRQMDNAARTLCVVFVGEDGFNGALQEWTANNLPDLDIRFHRETDDPAPWYQAADIFTLPSLSEGMSNALLEAMASGLAVIATDVGGNRDVIVEARTGRLVPPGDATAMAWALTALSSDARAIEHLGRAAREHILSNFTLDRMIKGYADRYSALAASNPDSSRHSSAAAALPHIRKPKPDVVTA